MASRGGSFLASAEALGEQDRADVVAQALEFTGVVFEKIVIPESCGSVVTLLSKLQSDVLIGTFFLEFSPSLFLF